MREVIDGENYAFIFENLRFLFFSIALCLISHGAAHAQESVYPGAGLWQDF